MAAERRPVQVVFRSGGRTRPSTSCIISSTPITAAPWRRHTPFRCRLRQAQSAHDPRPTRRLGEWPRHEALPPLRVPVGMMARADLFVTAGTNGAAGVRAALKAGANRRAGRERQDTASRGTDAERQSSGCRRLGRGGCRAEFARRERRSAASWLAKKSAIRRWKC